MQVQSESALSKLKVKKIALCANNFALSKTALNNDLLGGLSNSKGLNLES